MRAASPSLALPSLPRARWHTEFVLSGFTKPGQMLYGGQQALVYKEIKIALEAAWAQYGPGFFREWASQGHRRRYTKPECIFGDRGTGLYTLSKLCWLAQRLCPFYCSIWLSPDPSTVQCNRYALQSYLSTAQRLYKHGRKTLLESLKSSTGSFKPLPHTSGWDLMLCIKKETVNWNTTSFLQSGNILQLLPLSKMILA